MTHTTPAPSAAFDRAQHLLQQSAHSLTMKLIWRRKEQEWECQFIDRHDYHYIGNHQNIATAILDAAELASDALGIKYG